MKILSVVTLVSPNGEYGGPVRVAVNQLHALAERGHDVVLAGGTRGFDDVPTQVEGLTAKLFPAYRVLPGAGFAGLTAPGLWRAVRRHAVEFDVVHVHAARDLVTLPAARIAQRAGVPTLLQTHGMIDESDNPLAIPLDAALTRPALSAARAVTHLTPSERDSLAAVSRGDATLRELSNGVPEAVAADPTATPEVLFLARLAPRKRPDVFVHAASRLHQDFPDARFTLVGPDEGAVPAIPPLIADRTRWEGPIAPDGTIDRMRQATIYALPAIDEPYPMSVLEAMSVGLPVVVTDSCGLAPLVAASGAGIVVGADPAEFVEAVRSLLADTADARAMGARGRDAVRTQLGMPAIAAQLEALYRS